MNTVHTGPAPAERSLIIIAEHPDEWHTTQAMDILASDYKPGDDEKDVIPFNFNEWIDVAVANDWALTQPPDGNRWPRLYEGENLTYLFGDGPDTPARRRAHKLSGIIARYKRVVSLHGTETEAQHAAYGVHTTTAAKGLASLLGLTQALIVGGNSLWAKHPDVVGVELSKEGPLTINGLVKTLTLAAKSRNLSPVPEKPIDEYRYVGDISAEMGRQFNLPRRVGLFTEVPAPYGKIVATALGLNGTPYAHTWNADAYETRTGYWGEICERVESSSLQ